MPRMRSLAFLLLVALATPAGAAELYRCTVKGRTVYQDAPCKDGRKIDTDEREAIRGYNSRRDDGATPAAGSAPVGPAAAPAPAPAPAPAAPVNVPQAPPRVPPSGASAGGASDECPALLARAEGLRRQVQSAAAADKARLTEALRAAETQAAARKCAGGT